MNLDSQPYATIRDRIFLSTCPYNLSPLMWKILDLQITMLAKNGNLDIVQGLLEPISVCTGKPIWRPWVEGTGFLTNCRGKHHVRSVLRRAALGCFWRRFVRIGLSKTASSEVKETMRQDSCAPIGFSAKGFPCDSTFCPNCYMRRANYTYKTLLAKTSAIAVPSELQAIVFASDTVFKEKCFGFEPVAQAYLTDKLMYRLQGIPILGVKTIGATLHKRIPSTSTRIAVIVKAEDVAKVFKSMSKFKLVTVKKYPDRQIELELVKGLDNICVRLYDCPPVCLAGLSKEGLTDSCMQHSLEEYKFLTKGKKRTILFGTGLSN